MIGLFYINLEGRPDRRAFMEDQFRRLAVTATRVSAKTPQDVPPDRLGATIQSDYISRLTPMTRTEVACLMSHRAAWQMVVESGLSAGLILEDDARLSAGLTGLVSDPDLLGRWFDVIKIEGKTKSTRLGRPVGRISGRVTRRLLAPYDGAGAYIISAAAAERALADSGSWLLPVDEYLFNRPGILDRRVFQISPAIATQECFVNEDSAVAASSIERPSAAQLVDRRRRPRILRVLNIVVRSLIAFDGADLLHGKTKLYVDFDPDIATSD